MNDKIVLQTAKVPQELKKHFANICKEQDTNASREIRRFMRDFCDKHAQKSLPFK